MGIFVGGWGIVYHNGISWNINLEGIGDDVSDHGLFLSTRCNRRGVSSLIKTGFLETINSNALHSLVI